MDDDDEVLLFLVSQLLASLKRQRNSRFLIIRYLRRQRERLLYMYSQHLYPTYLWIMDRLASREIAERRFWSLPRPQNWFSVLMSRRDLDFWWKDHFRVSRRTFMSIVEIVRPFMTTQDNNFRPATLVEKKVAAALWCLATGESYRSIGITLGMGEASAQAYSIQFCDVIYSFRNRFISLPSSAVEIQGVIAQFSEKNVDS